VPSYYVNCPFCGARIDLPDDDPDLLFKVVGCDDCEVSFDYEPEDVQQETDESAP
jgi:hypothetical protein